MKIQQFPIGTTFEVKRGKRSAVEHTIIDFLTTTNIQNEVVKTRYVTTSNLLGQNVIDSDMLATTIAIALNVSISSNG